MSTNLLLSHRDVSSTTKSLPVAQIAPNPSNTSDDWARYWSYVKAAQQKGPQGYLESLYYLSIMRTYETSPARQQLLSNYLMTTLLPAINAYYLPQRDAMQRFVFSPAVLQNAFSVMHVIQMILSLFPREGEYLLHLHDMAAQLLDAERHVTDDAGFLSQLAGKVAALDAGACAHYVPPQQLPQQGVSSSVFPSVDAMAGRERVFPALEGEVVVNADVRQVQLLGLEPAMGRSSRRGEAVRRSVEGESAGCGGGGEERGCCK